MMLNVFNVISFYRGKQQHSDTPKDTKYNNNKVIEIKMFWSKFLVP